MDKTQRRAAKAAARRRDKTMRGYARQSLIHIVHKTGVKKGKKK